MKYRAKLVDPGKLNPERPVEIYTNSLEDVNLWAYGVQGGPESPRGVLPGAISDDAGVIVYAVREEQIQILTKRGPR